MAGGGLVDAPASVMETMFCDPHTGIVYTPPRFSDHVAVSCSLSDEVLRDMPSLPIPAAAAAAMRHAQPHKLTAPITAFFKAAARPQVVVAEGAAVGAKRAAESEEDGLRVQRRKGEKEVKTAGGKEAAALKRLFQFGSAQTGLGKTN